MTISIIIPTHNRADQLRRAIESVLSLKENSAQFEFVVVDNNSTDFTKSLVESYSRHARYVFEPRTSFTRARNTGAQHASGEILLYLDDDVVVQEGSLQKIERIFEDWPDCGVVAGRILPKFAEQPPDWALACQRSFNGWSLYDPDPPRGVISTDIWEVTWAAGPMMAVRKSVFVEVGGFPPDTVGVETNRGTNQFNKLYIGPGDYGLCHLIKNRGYKVYYSPAASVQHVIPKLRFTVAFWRSRMIGEGYHAAISNRMFFRIGKRRLRQRRRRNIFDLSRSLSRLGDYLKDGTENSTAGLLPEELWVHYYKAYLDMDWILERHGDLAELLWRIGYDGVSDNNYTDVMNALPNEFKHIVANEYVYCERVCSSKNDLISFMSQRSIVRHIGNPIDHLYYSVRQSVRQIKTRLRNGK